MARMTIQMEIGCTVRHDEETGAFVSHCPELKLYSAGNTEIEAREAMRSAVTLFLQWAYERKILGQYLLLRELMPDGGKQPCWRPGL